MVRRSLEGSIFVPPGLMPQYRRSDSNEAMEPVAASSNKKSGAEITAALISSSSPPKRDDTVEVVSVSAEDHHGQKQCLSGGCNALPEILDGTSLGTMWSEVGWSNRASSAKTSNSDLDNTKSAIQSVGAHSKQRRRTERERQELSQLRKRQDLMREKERIKVFMMNLSVLQPANSEIVTPPAMKVVGTGSGNPVERKDEDHKKPLVGMFESKKKKDADQRDDDSPGADEDDDDVSLAMIDAEQKRATSPILGFWG